MSYHTYRFDMPVIKGCVLRWESNQWARRQEYMYTYKKLEVNKLRWGIQYMYLLQDYIMYIGYMSAVSNLRVHRKKSWKERQYDTRKGIESRVWLTCPFVQLIKDVKMPNKSQQKSICLIEHTCCIRKILIDVTLELKIVYKRWNTLWGKSSFLGTYKHTHQLVGLQWCYMLPHRALYTTNYSLEFKEEIIGKKNINR